MARKPPTRTSRFAPVHCRTPERGKEVVPDSLMGSPEVKAHWMDLGHVLILEPITMCVCGGGRCAVFQLARPEPRAHPRCEEAQSVLRKYKSSLWGRGPPTENQSPFLGAGRCQARGAVGSQQCHQPSYSLFRGRALWFSKALALQPDCLGSNPKSAVCHLGDRESCQDSQKQSLSGGFLST